MSSALTLCTFYLSGAVLRKMFCGGATAKADVMLFQKLFAIIYALLTEASAFSQRMGLFMQGAMFVWIDLFPTFCRLSLSSS